MSQASLTERAAAWEAVPVIAAGTALYVWCVWNFAAVGRGTPGPWDAPSRCVAAGPYRWVRNPIYVAALLIVLGEAWLFMSLWLVAYAGAMAVFFHLFVTGYEERTLRRRFGRTYLEYQHTVSRWIPARRAAVKHWHPNWRPSWPPDRAPAVSADPFQASSGRLRDQPNTFSVCLGRT